MAVQHSPVAVPSADPAPRSKPHARWAVGLGILVAVGCAAAIATYAVASTATTNGSWFSFLGGVALLLAVLTSMGAFAMAVTAKIQRDHSLLLWLPVALFPAIVAFIVLS
jgi:amino acid transporter